MAEKNILDWLDLGEGLEKIDLYKKEKFIIFSKFFKLILDGDGVSLVFYLVLQSLFYIQICCITLFQTNISSKDYLLYIFKYISKIFLLEEIVSDYNSFLIFIIIITVLLIILVFCFSSLFILMNQEKKSIFFKFIIVLINCLVITILKYLIGPILCICLIPINCKNGINSTLGTTCFSDLKHLVLFIISIINFIFFLCFAIIFSIFYHEIGRIGPLTPVVRTKSSFDLYTGLAKIIVFILNFFFRIYYNDKKILIIIYDVIILFPSFIFLFYMNKKVYFYDRLMNYCIYFGGILTFWFCLIITIKNIFDIANVSLFILIGWILLIPATIFLYRYNTHKIILKTNILELDELKDIITIEMFNNSLLNLMNSQKSKNKTILLGFYYRFKEHLSAYPDIKEKFTSISNSKYLNRIYNDNFILTGYFIIYIIYDYYINKNKSNSLIGIHFCYFLINQLRNSTLAIYLCTKIRCTSLMSRYYNYILSENIKEYLVDLNGNNTNNNSPKNVQFSSVILYYLFQNLLRFKIADITESAINYFDYFKNFSIGAKSSLGFLRAGNNIIDIRIEIKALWDKINILNPFCSEIKKEYMGYIKDIIKDDNLLEKELKNHDYIKNSFLSIKNSFYFKMFDSSISAILLAEGDNADNKILYTTPNFGKNIYLSKETNELTVNSLLPSAIEKFHNFLLNDSLLYSNLDETFHSQRNAMIRTKNNTLLNIKLFVKELPNLSYGLIFIIHIEKIINSDYTIILDKDFKISGYSDEATSKKRDTYENYGLTQSFIGAHICTIIPELLLYFKCDKNKEDKIVLVDKVINQRGNLYQYQIPSPNKDIMEKINDIIAKNIKRDSSELYGKEMRFSHTKITKFNDTKILSIHDEKTFEEKYADLTKEIESCIQRTIKIEYEIVERSFKNDKYFYYILTLKKDIYSNELGNDLNEMKSKNNNNVDGDNNRSDVYDSKFQNGKEIKLNTENKAKYKNKKTENIRENNANNNNALDEQEINMEANSEEGKNNLDEDIILGKKKEDKKKDKKNNKLQQEKENIINNIRDKILQKKLNSRYSIIMLYINLLNGIILILLMLYDYLTRNNNLEKMSNYLKDNSYYNKTRVTVSNMYIILVNIVLLKTGFVNNDNCNGGCTESYKQLFENSINNIFNLIKSNDNFHQDYNELFSKYLEMNINNPFAQDQKKFNITNSQVINLLLVNCLKLKYNLEIYVNSDINNISIINKQVYETLVTNILLHSNNYLSYEFNGFGTDEMKEKINSNFYVVPFPIALSIIFSFLAIVLYIYLIYNMNNYEIFFLKKIINLNSKEFEDYLKKFEELKIKLKNYTEEEEGENKSVQNEDIKDNSLEDVSNQNQESMNKNENIKNNQSNNNQNNNINTKAEKSKSKSNSKEKEEKKNGKSKKKPKSGKKDREKKIKIAEQKKYKIKKMVSKILVINILSGIKILIPLILGITYYIIITTSSNNNETQYTLYNNVLETIDRVFVDSFISFLNVKIEIMTYANRWYNIKEGINFLEKSENINETYMLNETNYTLNELKSLGNYSMNISEESTPNFNNLIRDVIKIDNNNTNNTDAILYNLYNNDACKIVYSNQSYTNCVGFWSGVMANGLQQTIVEMGSRFSVLIDQFSLIKSKKLFLEDLLKSDDWEAYDYFIIYYLYDFFDKSRNLFNNLRFEEVYKYQQVYRIVFSCYLVLDCISLIIMIYFIYSVISLFNSFLNFIAIIPTKIIIEDKEMNEEIKKLEKDIS